MEEHLKDLNQTLNRMISEEPKFTDQHRARIRKAISKKRNKSGSKYGYLKAFVSVAASLLLIIASVQFIMSQSDGFESSMDKASGGESGATAEQSAATESAGDAATVKKFSDDTGALNREAQSDTDTQKFSLDETPEIIETKTIEGPVLPLNEKLLRVYEKFSQSHDQGELASLEPFEVMQLYYHSVKLGDHGTQYDLYYQDPAGTRLSKKEYLDDVKNHPSQQEDVQKLIDQINSAKSFKLQVEQMPMGLKVADITWGGTGESMRNFHLIFNDQQNVWTVSFTPTQ